LIPIAYLDSNILIAYFWSHYFGSDSRQTNEIELVEKAFSKEYEIALSTFSMVELYEHFRDYYLLDKTIKRGYGFREFSRVRHDHDLSLTSSEEERLFRGVPGGAVIIPDDMGERVELEDREQFRAVAMVAQDLVEGFCNAFNLMRCFRLNKEDGDAIDDEHYIGTDRFCPVRKREFIRDMKYVVPDIIGVDEPDVALPFFGRDKDRLCFFEVLPRDKVTFDGGRDTPDPFCKFSGEPMGHEGLIEPDNLVDENVFEKNAGVTAPHGSGFVFRDILPLCGNCIADERILH
jgi:hypothetical protein